MPLVHIGQANFPGAAGAQLGCSSFVWAEGASLDSAGAARAQGARGAQRSRDRPANHPPPGGSYVPRAKAADLDSTLAFLVGNIVRLDSLSEFLDWVRI